MHIGHIVLSTKPNLTLVNKMKNTPTPLRVIVALGSFLTASAVAQTTPAPAVSNDEVIVLSPFEVRSGTIGKYQGAEATSGGRVAVITFDTPANITTLDSSFIKDINPGQVLDTIKYAPGITQGAQPIGADRINIRGFQIAGGRVIDNFFTDSITHMDPAIIDHIEITKGPNFILSPSGSPGGTVNYSIKKPQFGKDFGHISLQVGQYDANRIDFDYNHRASDTVALRVVGGGTRANGYYHDYDHAWMVSPAFTWKPTSESKLTIQAVFDNHDSLNYLGLPVDVSVGNSNAVLWNGLSRNASPYDKDDIRHEIRQDYLLSYTVNITDNLSTRVAGHLLWNQAYFVQFNNSPAPVTGINPATGALVPAYTDAQGVIRGGVPPGGGYNPTTGIWDPNNRYAIVAGALVAQPAYAPDNNFNSSSFTGRRPTTQQDFQNDWVYKFKTSIFNSQTTVGFAYSHTIQFNRADNWVKSAFNIYGPYTYRPIQVPLLGTSAANPAGAGPAAALNADFRGTESIRQQYIDETVNFLNNRVILDLAASHNLYTTVFLNNPDNALQTAAVTPTGVTPVTYTTVPQSTTSSNLSKQYYIAGLTVKPIDPVAVYYNYSENASMITPIGDNLSAKAVADAPLSVAHQYETGVRFKLPNNMGTINVDYFRVTQSMVPVFNLTTGTTTFASRLAKGWEFNGSVSITKDLSIIANYTSFTNRDPNGIPARNAQEKSGALWVEYDFRDGSLKGLSAGLGFTYSAKRAGDSPSPGGQTDRTAVPPVPVINQPSFWLPAYTMVDLSLNYKFDSHWSTHLFVNNLFNKKYFAGSLNRNAVYTGALVNVKGSVTYSF